MNCSENRVKVARHLILIYFGVVLIPSFVSCKSCLGSPSGSIGITVYDDITKLPLVGVTVNFIISDDRTDRVVTTDSGLAFTSWTGGPDDILIHLEKDEYENLEVTVRMTDFAGDPKISTHAKVGVYMTPLSE